VQDVIFVATASAMQSRSACAAFQLLGVRRTLPVAWLQIGQASIQFGIALAISRGLCEVQGASRRLNFGMRAGASYLMVLSFRSH
jgi:hypothetical protein